MAAPESSGSGFGSALDGIVRGLRGNPPLLYGLGAGILIVGLVSAVGGVASDQLWLFVGALVLLVLAGLGAWLVVASRREAPRVDVSAGEDITARRGGRVADSDGSLRIKAGGSIMAEGKGSSIGGLREGGTPPPSPDAES